MSHNRLKMHVGKNKLNQMWRNALLNRKTTRKIKSESKNKNF